MTHWVDEILRRYGQEVSVERRDETAETVRAFLQPMRSRSESGPEPSPIGGLDGRLWLYLGKAPVRTGDQVDWNGRRFRARSGRPHYIGGSLSHWRAVLERAREAE